MKNVAALSRTEREELFLVTAQETSIPEAMIEKDFWVCWTLDYLFHDSRWKEHLAFKGGTSLSKCYDLIHRFSEDIDLILDWRLVGCERDEPWAERSKNQQEKTVIPGEAKESSISAEQADRAGAEPAAGADGRSSGPRSCQTPPLRSSGSYR